MRARLFGSVLFGLVLAACGGEDWSPEVTRIAGLALDETSMRGRIEGSTVQLVVPLEVTTRGSAKGSLQVELVDVAGAEDRLLDSAKAAFEGEGRLELALGLGGLDPAFAGTARARYVLRYRVDSNRGRLHGARDLWMTLPQAELQLLAGDTLPAGGTAFVRVVARDPAGGQPLGGAALEVDLVEDGQPAARLAQGVTDAQGRAVLTLQVPDRLASGTLRASLLAEGRAAVAEAPVRLVRSTTVLLSTDKPRYQPGQTVHVRALVLDRTDRTPYSGGEVRFELLDAKGNKVFKRTVLADAFGIASLRVPLASELNFGEWELRAYGAEGEARRSITVERYSLPKFRVRLATERTYYRPGEVISGTVEASYFFGRAVDGNLVVELQQDEEALASATGPLNDGGRAFSLTVPSRVADGTKLRILARVTDGAGQTVDGTLTLPVSLGDLLIAVVPDGIPVAGLPLELVVAVTDPNGQPVAATVELGGASVELGATGIGRLELAGPRADTLAVEARAADGRKGERHFGLAPAAAEGLVIRTDRTVYGAGEEAQVELLSAGLADSQVSLDLARAGRVIRTHTVPLVAGRGSLALALGSEEDGALVLQATASAAGGRLVIARRTLFLDGARELAVQVDTPGPVAPGEPTEISLSVRDAEGRGVPAAVGVTVVDAAVFALPGAAPGEESLRLAFGDSVPPAVAGHAVSEITGGTGAAREAAARLLFAAGGFAPAWPIDVNTHRQALGEVRQVLGPRFERSLAGIRARLVREVESGSLTDENGVARMLTASRATADVFGKLLLAEVAGTNVRVTSRGADELAGTADDHLGTLDLWAILSEGGYWGDRWWWEDGMDADGAAGPPQAGEQEKGGADATRVRSFFPETLLVAPSVLTDASGNATVPVTAADSITTWKIAASANSADGRLGRGEGDLVVFQDFFVDMTLPPTVTRGDELEIPVAVYNYSAAGLTVRVEALPEPWFELLSAAATSVTLAPGEVRGTSFRIRASGVGAKGFAVRASAGGVSDALRRGLLVEPGGERVEGGASGRLAEGVAATATVSFPEQAIPGGNRLHVKIYPGVMAQTVEGMDAILSEPHGCFEQSTSTTWPNVMVAGYLDATGTGTPETREKALGYIQKGHQLLVSYEAPQGGFNWWGNSDPGNRILTALGILILEDMKGIIEVDEAIIERSATWLASQQQSDGAWPKGDALHMGNEFLSEDDAIVTALSVQALAAAGGHESAVSRGAAYLASRMQAGIDAPFTLATATRALAVVRHPAAAAGTEVLARSVKADLEGRSFWDGPENHSWTGATEGNAGLETTAVAVQALLRSSAHPDVVQSALSYLAANKNSLGTWSQTQATVQALRAFTESVTGTGAPDVDAQILVTVDGLPVGTLTVTPEDSEVVRDLDLGERATTGEHEVRLELLGRGTLLYQVAAAHHLGWGAARTGGGLELAVTHSRTELTLGEAEQVVVRVGNLEAARIDQVLIKVGLPPGLEPVAASLERLVSTGRISRWERSSTGVVLYVPRLEPGATVALGFDAVAGLEGKLEAPATVAYRYYDPDQQAISPPVPFLVH